MSIATLHEYMTGWCCGAGALTIPPGQRSAEWQKGWAAGREEFKRVGDKRRRELKLPVGTALLPNKETP